MIGGHICGHWAAEPGIGIKGVGGGWRIDLEDYKVFGDVEIV